MAVAVRAPAAASAAAAAVTVRAGRTGRRNNGAPWLYGAGGGGEPCNDIGRAERVRERTYGPGPAQETHRRTQRGALPTPPTGSRTTTDGPSAGGGCLG